MEQCKWLFPLKACGALSCSTTVNDKVLPRVREKKKGTGRVRPEFYYTRKQIPETADTRMHN